jgi:hypothetical protein
MPLLALINTRVNSFIFLNIIYIINIIKFFNFKT